MAFNRDASVGVNLYGNDKTASKAIKGVGDAADRMGRKLSDLNSKIAKGVTVVAAATAAAAVKIGVDSVKAASDYNETLSKTQQIFGENAAALTAWYETNKNTLLMTKTQALDAASTFALFGQAAGLSGKGIVDFSEKLTQMSADFASFYNSSPDEAITAIGAALRGENEPIRRFNILLDDASLKAEAMRMGLLKGSVDMVKVSAAQASLTKSQESYLKVMRDSKKSDADRAVALAAIRTAEDRLSKAREGSIGTLTAQQKILAAMNLIMKQAAESHVVGDVAKTADGLANQQRKFAMQLGNMKVTLGTLLLPMVNNYVHILTRDLLPKLEDWVQVNGPQMQKAFEEAIPKVEKFLGKVGDLVSWVAQNKDTLMNIGKWLVSAWVGVNVAAKVYAFVTAIEKVVAVYKTLRTVALGAALAEAAATGGVSLAAGALALGIGATAFGATLWAMNGGLAGDQGEKVGYKRPTAARPGKKATDLSHMYDNFHWSNMGGGTVVNVTVNGSLLSDENLATTISRVIAKNERRRGN